MILDRTVYDATSLMIREVITYSQHNGLSILLLVHNGSEGDVFNDTTLYDGKG
jgi:hypothetical protein